MTAKKIYMICPTEHGAVLTFSDGSAMDVDRAFLQSEYPEPGGYYVDGHYVHGTRYEALYG